MCFQVVLAVRNVPCTEMFVAEVDAGSILFNYPLIVTVEGLMS